MSIAYAIVAVLLSIALLGSAFAKLSRQPKIVEGLTGLGVPLTWLPFLAGTEVAGALGLLVGLAVAPIGIAAAVGVVAYFIGAVASHVRANDSEIAIPAAFGVIAAVALVLRVLSM